MNECIRCGFWDSDYGACTCPSTDRWYACKFENAKPENIKALKECTVESLKRNTKDCRTCIYDDNDWELSGECYECIKGIADHYNSKEQI